MKTTFGSPLGRLLNSGVQLSRFERFALVQLVTALPDFLQSIVEAQFNSYNLVQREVDGRALNFYRKVWGRLTMQGVPHLAMSKEVAPLVRLKLGVSGTEVHAVLAAVQGRAFQVTFDKDVRNIASTDAIEVMHVTQAWRSNFPSGTMTPNYAMQRSARRR